MRVYISADIEGIAGISKWEEPLREVRIMSAIEFR